MTDQISKSVLTKTYRSQTCFVCTLLAGDPFISNLSLDIDHVDLILASLEQWFAF